MIVLPRQEEITLEYENDRFQLSQISENLQSVNQIEIADLTAMKSLIAFLQGVVETIENGKGGNE